MIPEATQATPRGPFEPTRWSLVLRARAEDTAQRHTALSELYAGYWSPLYAFLRRSGRSPDDARDLAQEFFVRLLDGTLLAAADPAKGRFRTLLLAGLRHLDANALRAPTRPNAAAGRSTCRWTSHPRKNAGWPRRRGVIRRNRRLTGRGRTW
jgi:RNA polymerase sigma-70 factor (ECF subfamily)